MNTLGRQSEEAKPLQCPQLVEARLKIFLHRRLRESKDKLILHDQQDTRAFARVLSALESVEEGTYGQCAHCPTPIEIARLLDDPATERCEHCASGAHKPVSHSSRFTTPVLGSN